MDWCEYFHLIRIISLFLAVNTRITPMEKNHLAIPYPHSIEIENILESSLTRFVETGLEDLARKWETILDNYRVLSED